MSGHFQVIYLPAAKDDLRGIYAYIAFELKARQTASTQVNRIRKEIRALDRMPERYPLVDWEPWLSMEMRKMSVGNYVVFYQVDKETQIVTVIRIFYGRRYIESIVTADAETD